MSSKHMKKPILFSCYSILAIWAIVTIYPLIYTLLTSFKTQMSMYVNMFGLPDKWHFENYIYLFTQYNIGRNIFNSLFLSIVTVAVQLVISSMAAYIITQFTLKIGKAILGFFIVGMLIPMQVLLIPVAIMAKWVNGYNSFPFITCVYIACGLPYIVFVISGFMKGLPKELIESAMIDGCGGFLVFVRIVLPLSRPAIATMGMLSFIGTWNELVMALTLLKQQQFQTVSLMLTTFAGERFSNFPGMCAAVIVAVLPTMILYFVFQENIIAGMTAGAVKG